MKITKKAGLSESLKKAISEVNKSALRIGWGENQQYPDGTYVATVAASNEFGNPAKKVPPRPFLRPAISHQGDNWKKQMAGGMKMVFTDKLSVTQVFGAVGSLVVADIQKSITSVTSPALAKSTLKARLGGKKVGNAKTASKPLEDSGYMRASVSFEEITK